MKKLLIVIALFSFLDGFAQKQRASPHDTVSNGNVTVTYGRPYKKDREIFGALEKYDKVWRVGADEATTITFKKDGKFGDRDVKAGTYTMFVIPREKEWTVILNSVLGQWGAYSYDKNKDKDVTSFTVSTKKLDKVVEQLTIRFSEEKSMVIEWDKTQVVIPVKF